MSSSTQPTLLALDIGAKQHAFAWEHASHQNTGVVPNEPKALRSFLTTLMRRTGRLNVLVEATGVYYLDVAMLAVELGAQVCVVNPKAAHNFAKAMQQRSKTDRLDAAMLLDFLKRMPFTSWTPPRKALLELRHYGRYLTQLTGETTAARNRLHALCSTQSSPAYLRADLKRFIASMEKRITRIRTQALTLIKADAALYERFQALTTIVGVADISAAALLSELSTMPPSLTSRACVCHAGLDPRVYESGTSVYKAPRISKHGNKYLRRALFHPALTAGVHDPRAKAFKERLIGRGKRKMQANVAIMRKMLPAAWAIANDPQPYDASKLYAEVDVEKV
ncbi:MAG: IS110 family transposase [Pseudomonadota bacterium]|nr:IS110 family transposase [Pseudomonadota bacterium]